MSEKIAFLQSLVLTHSPNAKSILELACGTGTILEGLSKNYKVSGLDLSTEMVKIAQQKLPNADIREVDMTAFSFGKTFDVVLCVFDSINHLSNWNAWQNVFDKAYEHLNEDGLFIFDFNPPKRLEHLTSFPTSVTELGEDYMLTKVKSEGDRYYFEEKVFEKKSNDQFEFHQEDIYEISFPVEQVKEEVSKQFQILEIVNNKNLAEDNPNWRPFFVCRKK
jgi:SAM-dependent methyltransferase